MQTTTEIEMIDVESSNIEKIGYDRRSKTLRLKFHYGPALYDFEGVSPHLYQGLVAAESKGTFFKERIKDKFTYTRINV